MKKFLLSILVFIGIRLMAQQDPQISHYMFLTPIYNPATVGISSDISIKLLNHNQWLKFEGAPQTNCFSIDAPINVIGTNAGIGAIILSDTYGFVQDMTLGLMGAYHMDLFYGTLSLGFSVGAFSKQFNEVNWSFPDQQESLFPSQSRSMILDFNLGVYYVYNNFYTGLSMTHITAPNFVFISEGGDEYQLGIARHFYFTAGYNINMSNSLFEIKPSVLVKSDASQIQVDINIMTLYNKIFWAGVSYRNKESIIVFIGTSAFKNIELGLSYDFLINTINRISNGTFEVYLGYKFALLKMDKPQHYHNVKTL